VKLIARVRGAPARSMAGGHGDGLDLLFADRTLDDGSTLLVGFGPRADWPQAIDEAAVERAVHALYPSAEVVAWALHDWTADPFSLGTWASTPPDRADALKPVGVQPDGPLVLAGSDVASDGAGWIEGALASGVEAAEVVLRRLGGAAIS